MNTDSMNVARPAPRAWARWTVSVMRAASTVLVASMFALLLVACAQEFARSRAPDAFGLAIVNALFVCLFLTRSDAKAVSTSPSAWALSLAGTLLPLLMRPSPGGLTLLGDGVQLAGIGVIIAALLSLRRSFGIVPANRGVRQGGLYRFVRHPLYAGEIAFISGFVLANPSLWNVSIWACDCVLQICRAREEERFLSDDAVYRDYCRRTRFRLVPFVY